MPANDADVGRTTREDDNGTGDDNVPVHMCI